jgi:hypothetical protein
MREGAWSLRRRGGGMEFVEEGRGRGGELWGWGVGDGAFGVGVGFLLVIMDINGWIFLGVRIDLTVVWVLALVLGSLGRVEGTVRDGWGPWGAEEGGGGMVVARVSHPILYFTLLCSATFRYAPNISNFSGLKSSSLQTRLDT